MGQPARRSPATPPPPYPAHAVTAPRHRPTATGACRPTTQESQARAACSRSTNFWILPVPVLGSSSTKTIRLGTLKRARRSRTKSCSSSGSGALPAAGDRDEGDGDLAPVVVGRGDDRGLGDRGVGGQRLLDLDRGDVLAAGDDHVLLAVAQLDVAVGVHDAEVAGVEPAAGERLARWPPRRGSSPSSRCRRASRPRPASRRRRARRPSRSSTTRRRSETTVPTPWRARSAAWRSSSSLVPVRVPGAHRDRPVGLGQPVQVGDVEVQARPRARAARARAGRRRRTPARARRAARPRRRGRSW